MCLHLFSFTRCLEIAVHNFTIKTLYLLSYRLIFFSSNFTSLSFLKLVKELIHFADVNSVYVKKTELYRTYDLVNSPRSSCQNKLQKGGVPATPSGTATLLRLSPSHQFCPRPLLSVTNFRHPRLPWLDGRCVQGPGTYSPRHG